MFILSFYHFLLVVKINAAKTPGIQPKQVNTETSITLPIPLSSTARGGRNIANITLIKLIHKK